MLAMWSLQDVLNWLDENKLGSLVQTFRIHKIDGKELDRIREKNDSKVSRAKNNLKLLNHFFQTLKQIGVQKEQRAQLRTALRSLGSTC